ncbi:hypothetical protein HPP92_010880 [Vanilla planifolia]|uniref:Uncharacterized protein n=1 Tax=Vanilla planifolia TaxID=51239 RepID=A0A835UZP2_VANPL|nr:hypothetical protein HPP92_010880 [Vanilla planifolia]
MTPSSFSFSQRKLAVKRVTLLTDVPDNVSFSDFSSICTGSPAPPFLLRRALSRSNNGGFFGFSVPSPSDRLTSSLGRFVGRSFLSVFRFKTWWSTMWMGSSGF